MAGPRSPAPSSKCFPEGSWGKTSPRQRATTSDELPKLTKSECLGRGSRGTYVDIQLDGVSTEDGEGGQIVQSPLRDRGCGTQEERFELKSEAMLPNPPVPRGIGTSSSSCSVFPAGQATEKHYFAAKMLFLKATVSEVAFCRKKLLLLLLLWDKENGMFA